MLLRIRPFQQRGICCSSNSGWRDRTKKKQPSSSLTLSKSCFRSALPEHCSKVKHPTKPKLRTCHRRAESIRRHSPGCSVISLTNRACLLTRSPRPTCWRRRSSTSCSSRPYRAGLAPPGIMTKRSDAPAPPKGRCGMRAERGKWVVKCVCMCVCVWICVCVWRLGGLGCGWVGSRRTIANWFCSLIFNPLALVDGRTHLVTL